ELGVVLQIATEHRAEVMQVLREHGLSQHSHFIGKAQPDQAAIDKAKQALTVWRDAKQIFSAKLFDLQQVWDSVSWQICRERDHVDCADAEHARQGLTEDKGLYFSPRFDVTQNPAVPFFHKAKPKVAILREQGVNSHLEMAYAFSLAGFEPHDVHMSDLQSGRVQLSAFHGMVACGGFSYGDTLGAGVGWARSILFNPRLSEQFSEFFAHPQHFAMGVCNGCQMLAELSPIIPGAADWPRFTHNQSGRFEARLSMVEVLDSPSIFFKGMAGSQLPIVVSHGEGFANFDAGKGGKGQVGAVQQALRFVDSAGLPTEIYPLNPNGSPNGLTGVTTADGRFTALMPHPERVFRQAQFSWTNAQDLSAHSPWLRIWQNARAWLA
ncbi:MAG: putative phosphoribosylformylglycinamidine synthase synthase, partial [Pseudomonadota bacterium]